MKLSAEYIPLGTPQRTVIRTRVHYAGNSFLLDVDYRHRCECAWHLRLQKTGVKRRVYYPGHLFPSPDDARLTAGI
jgi:hypothetical protein